MDDIDENYARNITALKDDKEIVEHLIGNVMQVKNVKVQSVIRVPPNRNENKDRMIQAKLENKDMK